ncbi:MAG: hypothetical protein ACLFNV_10305 [Desulfovibrionales bacterium]
MHSSQGSRTSIPFSGLGQDLSKVVARAGSLDVRSCSPKVPWVRPSIRWGVPRASGYDLLVMLGREIRGC